MTTASVRALARAMPDVEIHYLTQSPSDQIFRSTPHISKTHLFPSTNSAKAVFKLLGQLRREKYHTIIDFHGLPKTALITWLIGSSIRIGIKKRGRSIFYSHPVKPLKDRRYSAIQKTHLLSPLNIKSEDPKIDFFIEDKDRQTAKDLFQLLGVNEDKLVVSISPVSRRDYKVWPAKNFAAVCDHLIENYHAQILFLWGPGEYHFIEAVRSQMRQTTLPDYDIPSISETVAILERVDLHIGNDNGPMHFAVAAGVPTMAVFGRPLLSDWTPPDNPLHMAVEHDPGCKEDCFYPKCGLECIKDLKTDPVIAEIDLQMDRIRS